MRRSFFQIIFLSFLVTFSLLTSCTAYKSLPYLKNTDEITRKELLSTVGVYEPKVKPNDIISITVNSTVAGAAVDFNLPVLPTGINNPVQTTFTGTTTSGTLQNYVVDKDGSINFPVLGPLVIKGMTMSEVQEYLSTLIYPKYVSEKPIVNARFLNYKISVLGEVARPGSYNAENGQMTIFDALAAAGDMTIYGKRDNVLLIRTKGNGEIGMYRINMQDKSILLDKDIYYLQQNDKLYVETNKARGNSSRFGTLETLGLSALSVIISIIAIVTR